MQTQLPKSFTATAEGKKADDILRRCVHCGFCNNACPTYRQLGDETEGPRGRIYQMKRFLEGEKNGIENLLHLDHCLTCQSCESACPSGVEYRHLVDIVRPKMAAKIRRSFWVRWRRAAACQLLLRPSLLKLLLWAVRLSSPLLPQKLRALTPPQPLPSPPISQGRQKRFARQVILPDGCVQSAAAPDINRHTQALLNHIGVDCTEEKGFCCGALELHLEYKEKAMARIRVNVDRLYAALQTGSEAVISTASGCGRIIADYGRLLAEDPHYAERAKAVSAAHRDIAAFLVGENLSGISVKDDNRLSFHCPCTLFHGQKQAPAVGEIFAHLGSPLPPVANAGMCCGSAGFYSYEHPQMAKRLRADILRAHDSAEKIITANIGCQLHLQAGGKTPVRHWIQSLNC